MEDDLANTDIVDGLVAGDSKAILDLLQMVAPEWAGVTVGELQKDSLTGGYSGAALYKISSSSGKPAPVVVRVSGAGISTPVTKLFFQSADPGMPAAALKAWGIGATHEDSYCLDDARFPQVSVTEFVRGKTGDADLMNGVDAPEYCRAMGKAVAWMHAQDTTWFDQGPGKNEEQTAVKTIDDPSERAEILKLGRYDTYGKYFMDTLVTALKTDGCMNDVAEIGQRIFELLEPNTLMGRLVVGHGDLKYDNTMIRETSTRQDPQIVLIDYDRVMRMTAAADLGAYLHDVETKKYPSLANRRAMAAGYIEGCRLAGFDSTSLGRCSVDEVVLDMEVGLLMRGLWLSTIMTTLFPHLGWVVEIVREGVSRAAGQLDRARSDERLREKILQKGSAGVVGKGFAVRLMLRALAAGVESMIKGKSPRKSIEV